MTAKINLIGQPPSLQFNKDSIVTFKIIAGPASSTGPTDLPLFKATTYVVLLASIQPRARSRAR
jgi:hypothetical protein